MAMSKCARCGFEDVIEKKVDVVLRGGDDAAVVYVLADVCHHCGEQFYGPECAKRFDLIRRKLYSGQVDDFKPKGRLFRVPDDFADSGSEDMAEFLAELSD